METNIASKSKNNNERLKVIFMIKQSVIISPIVMQKQDVNDVYVVAK